MQKGIIFVLIFIYVDSLNLAAIVFVPWWRCTASYYCALSLSLRSRPSRSPRQLIGIHRVDVDRCNNARRENLLHHLGDPHEPKLLQLFVVVFEQLDSFIENRRDDGLAETCHASKAARVADGHNTREDRYADANAPRILHKLRRAQRRKRAAL